MDTEDAKLKPQPPDTGATRARPCQDCGQPFTAGRYAKFCPTCRPNHRRAKRSKYVLTGPIQDVLREHWDSTVRGRVAEIAKRLRWPAWAVKKAARSLGLCRPWSKDRRPWNTVELATLRTWLGKRSPEWIAKTLGRSKTSVANKIKRLGESQRIREGYTRGDLAECFHVDFHTVDRWVERGWLPMQHSVQWAGGRVLRCSEDQVRRFVRNHPMEFRLDKVDQVWFLGLVLGTPVDECDRDNTGTGRR